jgi:hypothetical protein
VAEYRVHGSSMSQDAGAMLAMTQQALRRQRRHVRGDTERRRAYREGRKFWKRYYGEAIVASTRAAFANGERGRGLRGLATLARRHPRGVFSALRRS